MFKTKQINLKPGSILIIGASSGIGAALATLYAGHGVSLFLLGRDAGRLDKVAQKRLCQSARIETTTLDVSDREALTDLISSIDQRSPLDLVIANAGIAKNHEDLEFAVRLSEPM